MNEFRGPSTDWPTVKRLVDEVMARPCGERDALLEERCGGDPRLRAYVESLLEMDASQDSDSLPPTRLERILRSPSNSWKGVRLGAYRILEEIGRGGMGAVFLAERVDGEYEQLVAVKVVEQGPLTDRVRQRFLLERQVLARLTHPNIACLLDGGTTDDGIPYLVMERIEGETILDYCRRKGLGLEERLVLFEKVCAAVGFAHRNLVVHRDLKPSNILVEEDGTPKLLDFGIAKLLDAGEGLTRADQMPGTLGYASPEQLLGQPVTTVGDVYSLGVVLYEMLSNEQPFDQKQSAFQAIAKAMKGVTPPAPSQALKLRLESQDHDAAGACRVHEIKGDLDRIVLRAMAADPAERYGSTQELAEDLRRFRNHEPVSAAAGGFGYSAKKFIRRRRGLVIAAGLVLLSLTGGIVARSLEAKRAVQQRERAMRERARAEELASFMIQDLWSALAPSGRLDVLAPVAEKLLSYYEDRAAGPMTTDEQLRLNATLRAVAQVLTAAGDTEHALEVTRRYVNGARALAASAESSVGDRQPVLDEVLLMMELAEAHRETGRHDATVEILSASLALVEEQRVNHQNDLELGFLLIELLDSRGIAFFDLGRLAEAHEAFSEACRLLEMPQFATANSEKQRLVRFGAFLHLGIADEALGNLSEASLHLDRSVTLAAQSWKQQPETLGHLTGLTLARSSRAAVLRRLGRPAEGLDLVEANIPPLEESCRRDPANAELRYQLADTLLETARCRKAVGDLDGQNQAYRQIVALAEPLLATTGHIYLLDSYVRALLALGRTEEAGPVARRLLAQGWDHQSFRRLCQDHGLTIDEGWLDQPERTG